MNVNKNGEVIVDIRVSINGVQGQELLTYGYIQLVPDFGPGNPRPANFAELGTFGKGQSMWIWKRKQGTCSGRMKPIIDIQLSNESVSTAKILSGYVCLPISISGQWVWIKRASTEEEENDAIVDMHVTQGSEKNLSDKIHQSPGVGWIKVGGNFAKGNSTSFFSKSIDSFVWFRPQRTRSQNFAAMVTPSGLSQDVRQSMILTTVRNTLRSHVPTREVKRLANLHMEVVENDASNAKKALRSDRLFDYAALYHLYDDSSKSLLDKTKFSKMLLDAGIRMDSNDVACVFYYFNSKLDGYISREEYSNMLTLTDSEIDILVDSIKTKLLSTNLSSLKASTNNSTNNAGGVSVTTTSVPSAPTTSNNALHDSMLLSKIFGHFNSNNDGMLSIDEILDLAASLEIFLTEEEARKLMRIMDINGNDRIEEPDFIQFMNKKSEVTVKKALRLRECVASFRRWLKDSGGKLTPNDNKTQQLWATFKSRHEKASQSKFPGHLVSLDILLIMAIIPHGTRVTMSEAREVALMVGPDAGGCISQDHLYNFVSRNCRSYGELLAILERDLIKKMVDAYRKYQDVLKNGGPSNAAVDPVEDAKEKYESIIKETVKQIQGAYVPTGNSVQDSKAIQDRARASTDVVSLGQLKAGVEIAMRGFQTNESQLPNLEEWACIASLVNTIVAGDNTYGVKITSFFELLCPYIVEGKTQSEKKEVEVVAADLQRMIQEEAKSYAAKSKNGTYDYRSVFALFDKDNSGTISTAEFKDMLQRLRLLDTVIESQIPQLINRFDMNRNGVITFEDFVAFSDSRILASSTSKNTSGAPADTGAGTSVKSGVPIPTVTKNKDCDELLWLLWLEAAKLEPGEPSWVINEIESLCLEIVATHKDKSVKGISVKELWSILIEIGIRSESLSKLQFEKGIKYLCLTSNSTSSNIENDVVDYTELCRYIIRMGRQYNQDLKDQKLNESKRFESLFLNLKSELKLSAVSTGVTGSTIAGGEAPRYERVFSRLDTDGDGLLSIDEFKVGLERLNVADVKEWTKPMIQRLFDEIDINRDGFISLKEFNSIIGDNAAATVKGSFKADTTRYDDDDDDDDDIFVNSKKSVNSALYTKVGDVLYDAIPKQSNSQNVNLNSSASSLSLNHQDEVKSAIRKYFSHNNTGGKGYTTDDKWRQFCRRSGLQSSLTSVEMRRLTDLLKVKKSSSLLLDTLTTDLPSAEASIDYEKLIKNVLFSVDDSAPRGKVDVVLQRLQDAVNNSNVNGRPFLGLCSLVDTRLNGRITKEELIHTIKMMGSTITANEVDLLCANIPELSSSKESDHIDYKELFYVINQFTPRTGTGLWLDTTLGSNSRRLANQTLPTYAQASPLAYTGANTPYIDTKAIATPGGLYIQTPYANNLNNTQRNRTVLPVDNDKRNSLLSIICNNVAKGINEKSHVNGAPFSILRQFEVYDKDNNGLIPLKTFVHVIEDLGVLLTSADVSYISQILGRPEDDQVSYDAFMQVFNSIAPPASNVSHTNVTTNFPSYFTARVLHRLREIKDANNDRDLKDYFEIFDPNRVGVIDNRKFREVLVKLNLLQTEYQINKAIDDFASLNDKSLVVYDNFLTVLHDYCSSMDSGFGYLSTTKSNPRYVYGSGYDGLRTSTEKERLYRSDDDVDATLASNNVEKWLRAGASPKQRKEFDEIFDSLQRFKLQQSSVANGFRDFPNNLEDGSYIPAPKVSESISLRGSNNRPPLSATSNRYNSNSASWDNDYGPTSPTRRSNSNGRFSSYDASSPLRNDRSASPMLPRTSPSKVGTVVWGRDIPISQKGRIPKLDDGNWCCAVCLYIENPISSKACGVCDTPNYTLRKDYSVKEICSNCTFSNGQLAVECEMCGEPLSRFHY